MGDVMTTRETIRAYFDALENGDDWERFLADDMAFTSHVTPPRTTSGRQAYVTSTRGFFSMIRTVEVQALIVEGGRACALTRYQLVPPQGEPFVGDVAEIFTVADGRITALDIYFDLTPYPG